MSRPSLHVIFKTHLDLGFTAYASAVRRQYHDHFIPMALDTGEHFLREDPAEPAFIWTTGSWLIWDHLTTQPADKVARLERAIDAGIIRWHALPFTTHTELMSPALVREGLSIAADLDRRFGLKTIAAKMTDVPGHTLGLVPLLAEAGIRFLHVGVNSASTPPDVPPLFRWRAPDGNEVMVMYQREYGSTFLPQGLGDGIAFAHTNDNLGPQSVGHVVETFHNLAEANPGFAPTASSLDAYAEMLWPHREQFPVVNDEIGDTWIHGIGSAPRRISRYLAARRAFDGFATDVMTPARRAFGRKLLEVPEHTWGVDIKTYLRDETAWDRRTFDRARQDDRRFAIAESSWAEQDAIVDEALAMLPPQDRASASTATSPTRVDGPLVSINGEQAFPLGPFELVFDPESGGLLSLSRDGETVLSAAAPGLFAFDYETYDAAEVAEFIDTYATTRPRWAMLDLGKPGLDRARTSRSARFAAHAARFARMSGSIGIIARMAPAAHEDFGAPAELHTIYTVDGDDLVVTVTLPGKPANRMPEAGFLRFAPVARNDAWRFSKLGLDIDPTCVVPAGNRQLHAADSVSGITSAGMRFKVQMLDSPLVAPASQPFMPFTQEPADMAEGVRFNLFNNKWGTNFAMWCQGDLAFRFRVSAGF